MFIGKEGEFPYGVIADLPKEKVEKSWLLILSPVRTGSVNNIGGLHCTLKNLRSITAILGDHEENVRGKILALGHEGVPAVLKSGEKSELLQLAVAVSNYVCQCNFTLTVAPSCV